MIEIFLGVELLIMDIETMVTAPSLNDNPLTTSCGQMLDPKKKIM